VTVSFIWKNAAQTGCSKITLYDLDSKRIVDFKVKRWADPFLVLRAALYQGGMSEEMKKPPLKRFFNKRYVL
jgi:hypothetical protein